MAAIDEKKEYEKSICLISKKEADSSSKLKKQKKRNSSQEDDNAKRVKIKDNSSKNDDQEPQKKRKKKKKKKKKTTPQLVDFEEKKPWEISENEEEDEFDNQTEQFEGFIVDGILLLRNKENNNIYASERDEEGNRVLIGKFHEETGECKFTSYLWKLPKEEQISKVEPLKFFVTDPADHCETSIRAYVDIKRALEELSSTFLEQGDSSKLKIYDPYYCTGKMKIHLITMGFPNVYNVNEDFYDVLRNNRIPKHDVLITNPPYSQDHIPKIINYCLSTATTSFLLLPGYVAQKDYFLDKQSNFFYLAPKTGRYTFKNPGIDERSKLGRTAPYPSLWYVYVKEEWKKDFMRALSSLQSSENGNWELFKTASRIPSRFFDLEQEEDFYEY